MNALVRRAIREHRATVVPIAVIGVLNVLAYIGIVRPLLAIAVFVALFLLHGRLFGAPLT